MGTFVDSTVKEIEKRLGELRQEVSRLEGALAALGAGVRRGPGRPRGSTSATKRTTTRRATSGRRGGTRRGRRGGNTRSNQALKLVQDRPGITIPEMAKAMSIQPNYLYRVLPKLTAEGKIRQEGRGYHPAK